MIDVVCGVIKNGDKYLITQRGDKNNYGKWEFPGGKVKENEHPFDSIKRELFEELEFEIKPIHEITRYPFKKFNLIFILCEPKNPTKIKLKEHLKFHWVQSDELFDFSFIEGDLKFIESFKK